MQYIRDATESLINIDCSTTHLQHVLNDAGGRAEFPGLFNLTGHLVAARLAETVKGTNWAILPNDSGHSQPVAWFNASKARNPEVARRHDAAHGYYVGVVRANATVAMVGNMPQSLHPAIVRNDSGFSRDVEIVDNGMGKEFGPYYVRLRLLR